MKVLVVGGGGREHAIVEALHRSQADIYAAMANQNPAIRRRSKDVLLGDVTDVERIVSWAKGHAIELAVIGPEAPLEEGITDALGAAAIPTVGPSREAAHLETNKEFTRTLMRDHQIPGVPQFWAFDNLAGFEEFVAHTDFEFVIKPLGLTGGKGVRVWGDHFSSKAEALAYGREILEKKIGGTARFLVEEKLVGEEVSLQAVSDGRVLLPMPLAQDHKRAYEGDKGPNTGGMGSYSDAEHRLPFLTNEHFDRAPGQTATKAGEQLKVDEESIRRTGAKLYYASVDEKGGHLYTTTSRSLAIVGIASNLEDAESISEEALAFVSGSFYARRDIGKPEVIQRKVERMRKIREGH